MRLLRLLPLHKALRCLELLQQRRLLLALLGGLQLLQQRLLLLRVQLGRHARILYSKALGCQGCCRRRRTPRCRLLLLLLLLLQQQCQRSLLLLLLVWEGRQAANPAILPLRHPLPLQLLQQRRLLGCVHASWPGSAKRLKLLLQRLLHRQRHRLLSADVLRQGRLRLGGSCLWSPSSGMCCGYAAEHRSATLRQLLQLLLVLA